MTSWNERNKTMWYERAIRILMFLLMLLLIVGVCVYSGVGIGEAAAPISFFAALEPGESIRYSYLASIGVVQFVEGGDTWLVRWNEHYYTFAEGAELVETISRPRIARTEGSGLLYVSSTMDKQLAYQVFAPRLVKGRT